MATATQSYSRFEDRVPIDVFIVSPNAQLRNDLKGKLSMPRWRVREASSGALALAMLRDHELDDAVLLLDPMLPDLNPSEFSRIVSDRFPNTQILMLNSHTGQLLVGAGSPTPVSAKIVDAVNRGNTMAPAPGVPAAIKSDAISGEPKVKLRSMVGDSDVMQRVYKLTRMVAARDTTVLVTGESGTGKDLIAQEIHLVSSRRNHPFVVVNCSAIPETLLEAELFGYTKGSFTGAVQSRIGRIHAAHGGTLFLDEIGDMPLSLQSKILRFLEQGEVQRLGGNDNLKVDVRVIAATNADLKSRVSQQQFREDLFYRLAVFPIHLPPLRERMGDIEELAVTFAAKFHPRIALSREAVSILLQHSWPGNVRELRNAIERATILVGDEDEIKPDHIIL
jgi:Response regulator containing CheY-like receiver, AAA-type ATPase, and DNA-binding domains